VPEAADLEDISAKYVFAYSIRMSLLPEGCIINGMHFSSCQLHLRHWVISANDTVLTNVNAEAVIGKVWLKNFLGRYSFLSCFEWEFHFLFLGT
jgi:F-box protein 3